MSRRYDPKAPRKRNEGVALVLALVFIVLLTVLVVEFLYESEVEASFAVNQGSDFEAYLAAKSAVYDGIAQLKEQLINLQNSEELGLDASVFAGEQYDSLLDPWAIGRPFEPMNDATMRTSMSDEYGKLNLNALLMPNEGGEPERNEPMIAALTYFFVNRLTVDNDSAPEALVDAILDWLDYNDDDNEHPDGAENDYYLGLENPYPCKNGPMDSIEELLLIKGFTPEFYFGDPEVDPPQAPLSEYLTVHGDWMGAVNVNTAPWEVLLAMAEAWQDGDPDTGNAASFDPYSIDEERQESPFISKSVLTSFVEVSSNNQNGQQDPANPAANEQQVLQGADPDNSQNAASILRRIFTIHSNCFRIYGDGQMDDIMVRVEAYVWRLPLDGGTDDSMGALAAAQNNNNGQGPGIDIPEEDFRILDWKVIR